MQHCTEALRKLYVDSEGGTTDRVDAVTTDRKPFVNAGSSNLQARQNVNKVLNVWEASLIEVFGL